MLFRLRGRTREQILQGLRQRRAGQESAEDEEEDVPEVIVPLEDTLGYLWQFGQPLETFSVDIRPAAVEMPLLKRLGEPAFVSAPGLQPILKAAYQTISQAAQDVAYADCPTGGKR